MNRRGFSLLEVAVAFAIFAVAGTFLVTAMVNNINRIETGHAFDDLIDLGRTRLEEAVSEGYPAEEEEGEWSDFEDTEGDIMHQGYAWRRIVVDLELPKWPEFSDDDEARRLKDGISKPYREIAIEVRRTDEILTPLSRVFTLRRMIAPPPPSNAQQTVPTGGGGGK